MVRKLLALVALLCSGTAQASWRVASSDHFVVYTQENEATARDAAARLEKFQFALRALTQARRPTSPIKVAVYLLPSDSAVQATMPFGGSEGIAGYYSTNIRGPYAIMSRDAHAEIGSTAQQTLLHELTHHFTFQYFPAAYPTWYTEGLAEYMGSMRFLPNDVVTVGEPVNSRYLSFGANRWLSVRKLVTAKSYADVPEVDLLYAEGWLLVHYLSNTNARPGQLRAFLTAINAGQPFDKAAVSAFGNLDKLNSELFDYAGRGTIQAMRLPFKTIATGPVSVRAASRAEEALIGYDMRLYSGIPKGEVAAFADRLVGAARGFANDPYALRLTYEVQQLAGRTADAAQTAKAWSEAAPDDPGAIAAQADVQGDQLVAAKSQAPAAWNTVRAVYARSLKLAPDQPQVLRAFYTSYARQGIAAPESAQNALYTAFDLLPQDDELRHQLAADFETRGMLDEAVAIISPAAFQSVDTRDLSPRQRARRERDRQKYRLAGDNEDETAREMLTRLEEKRAKRKQPAAAG